MSAFHSDMFSQPADARALFERIVPSLPADKARPLWTRWAAYEYYYSDLPSALKLEQRLADTFADEQPIRRFAERHTHQRVDKIATNDLGYGVKAPTAPIKMTETNTATKRAQPVDLEEERNKRLKRDTGGTESGRSGRGSRQTQLPLPPHRNQRNSPAPAPNVQIGGAPIHLGSGRPVPVAVPPPARPLKDPLAILLQMLPQARYFDGPIINTEDILFAFRNLHLP